MNRRESIIAVVALGAAAGPIASFAQQQGKVWRVGFLTLRPASENSQDTDAFLKGMRELGYVEGKNLVVEWRFADGKFKRLPGLAAELVQLKVDVIVAVASPAIGAAQKATTRIPIRRRVRDPDEAILLATELFQEAQRQSGVSWAGEISTAAATPSSPVSTGVSLGSARHVDRLL